MTTIDPQTLQQIETALTTKGFWVAPSMTSKVPVAVQQQILTAREGTPVPVYSIVVDISPDDPVFHGDVESLIATIRDDTGHQGMYLGTTPEYPNGYVTHSVVYPDDSSDFYVGSAASDKHPNNPGQQVLTAIGLVKSGNAKKQYDTMDHSSTSTSSSPSSDDGGGVSGATVGTGLAVTIALVAVFVALRRRRTPTPATVPAAGSPKRSPRAAVTTARPFSLPPAVLGAVRAAEDKRNADRAESDVLSLGEAIDKADMTPDAAGAQAWQAALDHYDLARRILERDHSPADAVGAIVLASRGETALTAARAGRSWTPVRPCYLNPLHGAGSREVQWRGDSGTVTVPACAACAKAIRAGREPDDVLDFVVGGTPRHYFELDLDPWSSTGYGALEPDLLTRLFSR